MAELNRDAKAKRLLTLYTWLKEGKSIKKSEAAAYFHVAGRSIQRDLEELRCFLCEQTPSGDIIYDPKRKGYILTVRNGNFLNDSELLAVCKILLESRSMIKAELNPILDKLVACCVPPENRMAVKHMIANERDFYVEPRHEQPILSILWELSRAVQEQRVTEIEYERLKEPHLIRRVVEPVGVMFSEYYFYLIAFPHDEDSPSQEELSLRIYRIDRICSLHFLEEHFFIPYKDRFKEGEFRKRVQFMFGGKLQTVQFKYTGLSIEAVLDRLPTAKAEEIPGGWLVTAEVFGTGIDMWLRSQGGDVERIFN